MPYNYIGKLYILLLSHFLEHSNNSTTDDKNKGNDLVVIHNTNLKKNRKITLNLSCLCNNVSFLPSSVQLKEKKQKQIHPFRMHETYSDRVDKRCRQKQVLRRNKAHTERNQYIKEASKEQTSNSFLLVN